MTFKELVNKYKDKRKVYEGIFALSNQVKTLEDYLENKQEEIDFSIDIFDTWYQSNIPIERITKQVIFYKEPYILLDNVFCPRHETELLVQEALKIFPEEGTYIDLCSGTGIIGISILKHKPNLKTTLLDISPTSIKNINLNLKKHNLKAKVIQEDWLSYLNRESTYKLITANFPYIGYDDPIDNLSTDPEEALYAQENGWEHYGKLLEWMKRNDDWEIVVLECNSFHLNKWKEIKEFKVKLIMDWNDLLRVVIITKQQGLS